VLNATEKELGAIDAKIEHSLRKTLRFTKDTRVSITPVRTKKELLDLKPCKTIIVGWHITQWLVSW
jgi:hypothetical protein